jgi:hypothetical protein
VCHAALAALFSDDRRKWFFSWLSEQEMVTPPLQYKEKEGKRR